jgi:hypothetical protein
MMSKTFRLIIVRGNKMKENKMKDRFSFEQEIFQCWHITDDLNVLNESVLEKDISRDEISNILLGLEQLYNQKFSRLFSTFEELISKREI